MYSFNNKPKNFFVDNIVYLLKKTGLSIALTTLILGVMWGAYFFVNVVGGTYGMGVHPRNVGFAEVIGVFSSWMYHGSWNHIVSNTVGLVGLLPFVGFFEKKPFRVTGALILLSGFFTWVLGASGTNHIGASGLIFALIGYIAAAGTIGLKFRYLIPIFLSGASYWYSVRHGLIPQDSVSFAGHFGGLLAGLILGFFIPKYQREEIEKEEDLMSRYAISSKLNLKPKKWYEFWKKDKSLKPSVDWSKEVKEMQKQQLAQFEEIKKRQKMLGK